MWGSALKYCQKKKKWHQTHPLLVLPKLTWSLKHPQPHAEWKNKGGAGQEIVAKPQILGLSVMYPKKNKQDEQHEVFFKFYFCRSHLSGKGQMWWRAGSGFFSLFLQTQASGLWWNSGLQTGSGSPAGKDSEFCGGPRGTVRSSAA